MSRGSGVTVTNIAYTASDLQNRRTEILSAAVEGQALIRVPSGAMLVMLPAAQLWLHELVNEHLLRFLAAERAVERHETHADAFGGFPWLSAFDNDDRREFLDEFRDALASAAGGDPSALSECVEAWRTTARALNDPVRRQILTGPGTGDYAEAPRPTT